MPDEQRARIGHIPRGHGLLGLIIRENRAIRARDLMTDPRRYGFPEHHPPMHSFLGVPVTVRGMSVGNLYLTEKQDAAEFTDDDERLVANFARHAGIAIERARLHEEVQRLAIGAERERISQDLHDGIIQSLYAVGLSLEDVPDLMGTDTSEATERVESAIDAIHGTIRDIRNFVTGLRPEALEEGSLSQSLKAIADEAHRGGVREVRLSVAVDLDPDDPANLHLLQTAREAVSNAVRHADASSIAIDLRRQGTDILLEVTDDGRGFQPDAQHGVGHHGLANMRARARSHGGDLTVTSAPDNGTRITLRLPEQVRLVKREDADGGTGST
jgi:signal transduction histidine kinase